MLKTRHGSPAGALAGVVVMLALDSAAATCDTTCKGHKTAAVGPQDRVALIVPVAAAGAGK